MSIPRNDEISYHCFWGWFYRSEEKYIHCKKKPKVKAQDFNIYKLKYIDYISSAFVGLLSINNSTGFSNASFTATKKPTDSRPSIIL